MLMLSGLLFGLVPGIQAQDMRAYSGNTNAARMQPRLADAILVVVNSDVITRYEFLQRLQLVEQRLQSQGGQIPPVQQLQRQLLECMIVEKAQLQQAKERGIHVDDAMLNRAISRIAEQNNMVMAEFRQHLEQDGISYRAFCEEIRNEITMQRLHKVEVDNKIQISDAEIDAFVAAHGDDAAAPQELNIAQILIRIPENPTQQQLAQSKQRADEVLAQLQASGDFAKLAAVYSDAPDSLNSGELGWRTQNRLPQLFVDATANLQQGQIAPLVRSANGFHILKLAGRRTQSVVRGAADGGQQAAARPSVQQTHASHILIKVNHVVTAAEARRKLTELKQRLENQAATFEELARLHSNDFSASKGGDLGWIYPGDTVLEFERAMNELTVGQISEPIESPFGYHLILVKERKVNDVSQERQRMVARQAIREQKIEEAIHDWLRQVRDQAYVEYRIDEQ